MKPQSLHAQEDRLLDFAYGELPPTEARAVESHLEGCTRCSELLADIRGVRTTMAQLPIEPAPDAGLESLLAYAQQAARNAAAGPAPKPTWWRRWLVPAIGVAAVCFFGIISIQVSKTVDLRPELAAKSEPARHEVSASESVQGQPPREPMAPAPVAQAAPTPAPPTTPVPNAGPAQTEAPAVAVAGAVMGSSEQGSAAMTPPSSYPAARLDDSVMKEAPRKQAYNSASKVASVDYSNAGAGPRWERSKAAKNDELAVLEKKSEKKSADKLAKDEEYNQRDAMTQMGAISKTKGLMVGSTQGDSYQQQQALQEPSPPPAAAQPAEERAPGGADGALAEADAPQKKPSRGSALRLSGGSSTGAGTANKPAADSRADDLDELFDSKTVVAKREQQQSRAAMPAPPPPAPAAAPKPSTPSVSMAAPSTSMSRAEGKGRSAGTSSSELSKQAQDAFRSGNRVLEAELLAQALEVATTDSDRLNLLNRLCDAQFAIGQRDAAIETCNRVLELGPRSGAAQVAQRRLSREVPVADDAKVLPGARASKKAAPVDTESAAPASMPAQAQ